MNTDTLRDFEYKFIDRRDGKAGIEAGNNRISDAHLVEPQREVLDPQPVLGFWFQVPGFEFLVSGFGVQVSSFGTRGGTCWRRMASLVSRRATVAKCISDAHLVEPQREVPS